MVPLDDRHRHNRPARTNTRDNTAAEVVRSPNTFPHMPQPARTPCLAQLRRDSRPSVRLCPPGADPPAFLPGFRGPATPALPSHASNPPTRSTTAPAAAYAMAASPTAPAGSGAARAAATGPVSADTGWGSDARTRCSNTAKASSPPRPMRSSANAGKPASTPVLVTRCAWRAEKLNFRNLKLPLGPNGVQAQALKLRLRHSDARIALAKANADGIDSRLHLPAPGCPTATAQLRKHGSRQHEPPPPPPTQHADRRGTPANDAPPQPATTFHGGHLKRRRNKLGPVATRANAQSSRGHPARHLARQTALKAQQVVAEVVREPAWACSERVVLLEGRLSPRSLPSGRAATIGVAVARWCRHWSSRKGHRGRAFDRRLRHAPSLRRRRRRCCRRRHGCSRRPQ